MEKRVDSDIAKLVEQTTFLLGKQEESKEYCSGQFVEFISLIENEIKSLSEDGDKDKILKLKAIAEIVTHQLDEFKKDVTEDIDFLQDQLNAIKEIKEHKDPIAAAKLLIVLMDGQEIPETEKFKADVEEESKSSKASFVSILEDLKNTLLEGGVEELLNYLQDMEESGLDEDDGESIIFEDAGECCSGAEGESGACCGGHAIDSVLNKSNEDKKKCRCGKGGCCTCSKDGCEC